MSERELAILVTAKNMASKTFRTVGRDAGAMTKSLHGLSGSLRTIGKGAAIAGGGLLVLGAAAIKSGLDSLAEREDVMTATANAIEATGGAARIAAPQVRSWAEEIEAATGAAVDDKAIQAGMNALLRIPQIGGPIFKRTAEAATDLGAAMKTGPEDGAKLLGKALADPLKGMTALKKAGIILTASEKKRIKELVKANQVQDAQVEILKAVEKRSKGAAAASAGPYTRSLNMLRDASEDAKMALAEGFLPILTDVATTLSKELAKPKTIEDIRGLGRGLADGFKKVVDATDKIPWQTIKEAMAITGEAAQTVGRTFLGLPPWVQTAVLTGWGLNKLTGGAAGTLIGEAAKGLIKGVLGINAGVVNIKAGTVTGGGAGIGPAGKGSIAGAIGKVFLVGAAIGAFAELKTILDEQSQRNRAQAAELTTKTGTFTDTADIATMEKALEGILAYDKSLTDSTDLLDPKAWAFNMNIDGVRDSVRQQEQVLRDAIAKAKANTTQLQDSFDRATKPLVTEDSFDRARLSASRDAAATAAAVRDKDLSLSLDASFINRVVISSRELTHSVITTSIRQDGSGVLHNGAN